MGSPACGTALPICSRRVLVGRGVRDQKNLCCRVREVGGGTRLCLSWQSGLSLVLCSVVKPCLKRSTVQGSPKQVVESLLMPSIQASGVSSSAGWLRFCKTPKMLPLLLMWKAFVTVLLKCVCSWGMFGWFGVLFHWRKGSVETLLEKSARCYMMCCYILLTEIQQDIIWQISTDSWEGDRTTTSPGYLTSCSSCNLFLKVYLVCL